MSSQTPPPEYRTISSQLQLKRIHQTPPPFSILKSIINSKLKKPHEIMRMSTSQLARTIMKRPETPFKLQDKLKIVGQSHQYNKYFETESKPLTSQIVSRKTALSITRQSFKRKSQFISTPKHSMQDFNKLYAKQDVEIDQILYRNSAKLQILVKQKQVKPKNILLILSVQFVLNQNKFWKQDEIDEDSLKHWKKLQAVANIVWVVKKQKSSKKLQSFAEKMGINIDTIALLKRPKKKRVITVNLRPLQLQIGVKNYQKVIYIDALSPHHSVERNNEHYLCKFPITSIKNISINLVESEQNLKNVFGMVPSILYKQSPITLNIESILQSYSIYLSRNTTEKSRNSIFKLKIKHIDRGDESGDQQSELLKRIEQLKGTWIRQITTCYKMKNKQRQSQKDSIPYAIGDLLKRNFSIMCQIKSEEKKLKISVEKPNIQFNDSFPQLKYNNVIYIWKF